MSRILNYRFNYQFNYKYHYKFKFRWDKAKSSAMMVLLAGIFTVTPGFAQAKSNAVHPVDAIHYDRVNDAPSFRLQQVDYNRGQNKQYRYGDHYRAYKKKYHRSNNFPNKYYYPPHHQKKQYRHNNYYGNYGYDHRQFYKPLRQKRLHSGIKTGYWSAHKYYGYKHKRIANQHYYYNKRGFYFPGFGTIAHGHRHNDNCEDWHFSALLASSILLSIYNN